MDLKTEATNLGLDFKGNISKADLTNLVNEAKNVIAKDSKPKKIKVIITARDSGAAYEFVGFNNYSAQFKFDEELEMPEDVVEFLKTRGGNVIIDGKPKWQSRFIIEKL